MMTPDLYDLALRLKSTSLGHRLNRDEPFAVKFSDGHIGCCVMDGGRMFSVFTGDKALRSYRQILQSGDDRAWEQGSGVRDSVDCLLDADALAANRTSQPIEQHGIQLVRKEGQAVFQRSRPGYVPQPITSRTDKRHLAEALEAALDVAVRVKLVEKFKLGFGRAGEDLTGSVPLLERDGSSYKWSKVKLSSLPDDYPSPRLESEVMVASLKRCPQRGEWHCALCQMPTAMTRDGFGRHFYPTVLIWEDDQGREYIPSSVENFTGPYPQAANETLLQAATSMLNGGVIPKAIIPYDEETSALLREFCQQIGIALMPVQPMHSMELMKAGLVGLMSFIGGGVGVGSSSVGFGDSYDAGYASDDAEEDDDENDLVGEYTDAFAAFEALLGVISPKDFHKIADEHIQTIRHLLDADFFDPQTANRVMELLAWTGGRKKRP